MNSPTVLTDRAILAVSGPDSRNFLQGLITNDVRRLESGASLYAALLTPQGKVLFDFLLYQEASGILLDCAAEAAEVLHKRLSIYRLRAKVDIVRRDDLAVLARWNGESAPTGWRHDPRVPALGSRRVVNKAEVAADALSASTYLDHRLALGVPEGADFGQDKIFALDADLDELQAVSFDKGCYVGQELTARMKHRGTARKKLLPVDAGLARLPCAGTPITAAGNEIGTMISVHDGRGFALVRIDRLQDAGSAALDAGGVAVRVVKPHWLFS
jgi:folate-binding protein YgfZ